MLSDMKSSLQPIGFTQFKEILIDLRNEGRFRNLILSGAEVTTCADLEKYIRYAASLGCFKKIQIQTNGRKLADKVYVKRLIENGVNEFFISIHGLEDIHDRITACPGSFQELRPLGEDSHPRSLPGSDLPGGQPQADRSFEGLDLQESQA